jgi:hypothetical protein
VPKIHRQKNDQLKKNGDCPKTPKIEAFAKQKRKHNWFF